MSPSGCHPWHRPRRRPYPASRPTPQPLRPPRVTPRAAPPTVPHPLVHVLFCPPVCLLWRIDTDRVLGRNRTTRHGSVRLLPGFDGGPGGGRREPGGAAPAPRGLGHDAGPAAGRGVRGARGV